MDSPCIDQCALVDGICAGCGRTSAEIVSWAEMTDEERRQVIERLS